MGVTEGRFLENVKSPRLVRHRKANDARDDADDVLDSLLRSDRPPTQSTISSGASVGATDRRH